MTTWGSYPKIWNLGHPAVRTLFEGDVIVEEKVDGSQFSFGAFRDADGNLVLKTRSKGCEINPLAPPTMFGTAVATAVGLFERGLLREGWTYRGEALAKPKHNTLCYDRTPQRNVILFDVCTGMETYLNRDEKEAEAVRLDLEVVPVLHRGSVETAEQLRGFFDRVSVLGGSKIEGVVIKNYARFGLDGHVLLGKFVSEAFKEVHGGEWRKENPQQGDILSQLIVRFKSPARWAKAVQHLREAGTLTDSPKDIGPLIRETIADMNAECRAEIAEILLQWAMPHVRRACTAGLPEWYKEQLMELQFSAPADPDTFPKMEVLDVGTQADARHDDPAS